MSKVYPREHTIEREKAFIAGLGSYSKMGVRIRRAELLRKYMEALRYPSRDDGYSPEEVKALNDYATKQLRKEE